MNGAPPKETAALVVWLCGTFELIANDIGAGRALSKDLRKAIGFMGALRIDTRSEVNLKARAIDQLCVRELTKRQDARERSWLQHFEDVVSESSADVAHRIDEEILAEVRDLRRNWSSRIFRRMCRRLRRLRRMVTP